MPFKRQTYFGIAVGLQANGADEELHDTRPFSADNQPNESTKTKTKKSKSVVVDYHQKQREYIGGKFKQVSGEAAACRV